MKKLFLFAMILLNSIAAYTQLLKENIYDFDSNDHLGDMIITSDSNLLFCASINFGINIFQTDLSGELIWEKNYNWGVNSGVKEVVESNDGNFVIAGHYGNQSLLMKITNTGDSLWCVLGTLSPNLPVLTTTVKCFSGNNNLLISYETDRSYLFLPPISGLYLADSLGTIIYTIIGDYSGQIKQTEILNDTSLLICGVEWLAPYEGTNIKKYNTNGDILSTIYNNHYSSGFITDANENIYLSISTLDMELVKLNSLGETEWELSYFPDSYSYNYETALIDNLLITTGGFSVNPTPLPNSDVTFYIALSDTSGQFINTFTNDSYFVQFGEKIIIDGDNILIAGDVQIEEGDNNKDIFLNIYSIDSLYTSIGENNHLLIGNLNAYPNPATAGSITFEFKNTEYLSPPNPPQGGTNNSLVVFNVFGEKVHEENIYRYQGESVVDVSGWPQGMYVAVVYSAGLPAGSYKFVISQ